MNRLPPLVQREGILVSQVMPSMLMKVNIYSTDKSVDQKFLYNFANVNILPVIKRIQGMGRRRNLGNRTYAMRIWLKPDRMRAYKISSEDVMKAAGGAKRYWFARTTRPGHGQDVAIPRVRPDLCRAATTSRSSMPTSF